MTYSSFCTWCASNLGYYLEAPSFCSESYTSGGVPQELSAKSSFPEALAARGEALQVGPSSVGLMCRRCSTFNFLGLPFPQKERQVLIPH